MIATRLLRAIPPSPPTKRSAPSSREAASSTGKDTARASTRAEQNDLFAEGTAAKQQGRRRDAIDIFDRFLARYPTSPLTESAMVERMTLVEAGDHARALEAAKVYLERFPRGFARAEAEAIRGRK